MSMIEMDSPEGVNLITQMIQEIVQKELKKYGQFNRMQICKVITADNTAKTATIELISDGTSISGVKNRTNQNLATNDLCYCLFINGSSGNFVLTIKC